MTMEWTTLHFVTWNRKYSNAHRVHTMRGRERKGARGCRKVGGAGVDILFVLACVLIRITHVCQQLNCPYCRHHGDV